MLRLFEVAGAEEACRPSPYCWRIRMALAHKGLECEFVPWRAFEKQRIARSGGGTVPVLVDGGAWLPESWDIACHLEERYPGPPLFQDRADRAKARFLDAWTNGRLHPLILRAVLAEQLEILDPRDRENYHARALDKYGVTVEALCREAEAAVEALATELEPLGQSLRRWDFLGGRRLGYGDYILFGALQWARIVSRRPLLDPGTPLAFWFERLLSAFDDFAARSPARN